ncbi:uncharacterized protein EDB91DRAFT_1125497 [Suillus paluster]|uniref:uncharacterized protein n=1 Tax=Suillus paluster TaxID=48578 RepID=UPI001B87C62A|nr:uncharacterized protein EDB91DRAFT_1125497 [Suillus paluster]KAG1743702.1 hypothetical protein EDB91DRAFT_1125497 [Suillus paluster]
MLQAFIFFIPRLALGVWLLTQLNEYSLCLELSTMGLVLYPAIKRITDWLQGLVRCTKFRDCGYYIGAACQGYCLRPSRRRRSTTVIFEF